VLNDAAAFEHNDAFGYPGSHAWIVSHVHDGHTALTEDVAKEAEQFVFQYNVEAPERLVEQNGHRLEHERSGDGHALTLAA
jgi:hypothetical protein